MILAAIRKWPPEGWARIDVTLIKQQKKGENATLIDEKQEKEKEVERVN